MNYSLPIILLFLQLSFFAQKKELLGAWEMMSYKDSFATYRKVLKINKDSFGLKFLNGKAVVIIEKSDIIDTGRWNISNDSILSYKYKHFGIRDYPKLKIIKLNQTEMILKLIDRHGFAN